LNNRQSITVVFILFSMATFTISARAQPIVESLRSKVESVLTDGQLTHLERLKQLQLLLDSEEQAVFIASLEELVIKLGNGTSEEQSNVRKQLLQAGEKSIGPLSKAAMNEDRESALSCLAVLEVHAQSEDETVSSAAYVAIEVLAKSEKPAASRAAAFLAKRVEERALKALVEAGRSVYRSSSSGNVSVTFQNGAPTIQEAKSLAAVKRLSSVSISGPSITEEILEELAKLEDLKQLYLTRTGINDQGLKQVATMKKLERLSLSSEVVTSHGLKHLADAPLLYVLTVNDIKPTLDVIDGLRTLKLRGLGFRLTNADDDDLRYIGRLNNVFSITALGGSGISDAGLAEISHLDLRTLSLEISSVTEIGIRYLRNMESLSDLTLSSPEIADDGLKPSSESGVSDAAIAEISHLDIRTLSLKGSWVSDHGIRHLRNMKSLSKLTLFSPEITDDGLIHLMKLTKLKYVTLYGTTRVTLYGIAKLKEENQGIKRVSCLRKASHD